MDEIYLAYLRMFIALPVVIVLAYYGLRWGLCRLYAAERRGNIKILERAPLGPRGWLYIVQVGDKYFLLSQSSGGGITFLQELGEEDIARNPQAGEESKSAISFAQVMSRVKEGMHGPDPVRYLREKWTALFGRVHEK